MTGEVVKKAACKMKPAKSDVSRVFSFDAVLHALDSFFDILALGYRSWLLHGTVNLSLLPLPSSPSGRMP